MFLIGALRADAADIRVGVQFLNPQVASGNNSVNGSNAGAPGFTQSVWNGVFVEDNSNPTFTTWSQSGIPLTDQSGAVSPIRLSYFCQGSLPTDAVTQGQPSVTSHEKLLSNAIMTFCDAGFVKFTNVPNGSYDLVIYTVNRHGDGGNGTVSQFGSYRVNGGPPVTLGNQFGGDFTASGDSYKSHAGYPLTAGNVGDANNASNYFVFSDVVPDAAGEITLTFNAPSNDAAVNAVQLLTPSSPIFTTQPRASTVTTVGSSVTISVVAPTATAFQWEKSTDGGATFSKVSGATSATLTLTNAQTSDGGIYRVVATTPEGSYTSSNASVTVFASNPNDPPVFVAFRTSQVASGSTPTSATTSTINAPGSGWPYSAAAQVAGTTWNQIRRPNPLIGSGTLNGTPGTFVCNSADNIGLTSATGAAMNVRLTMQVVIADPEVGSTTRVEPNGGAGGNTVLGPNGMMDNAWRIYRGGNSSIATFTGLTPNAHYLLYVYGSITATGQGCAFTLNSDNVGSDDVATKSTAGENSGNIFSTDGSTYTLTEPGTTWQQFHAVANSAGNVVITTTKNANNGQYYNGLQLVQYPLPVITVQPPASTQGTINGSVSITASAANGAGASGTLSYQWQKSTDGGATFHNIDPDVNASAVAATLSFTNLQNSDTGIYRVLVTHSVSGGTVISSNASLTVQSIFDSWKVANFGSASNPNAASNADPEGDGIINAMEFSFGLNPNASDSGPLMWNATALISHGMPVPGVESTPTGVNRHAVFIRRHDWMAAGLTYTVQFSYDLRTWEDNTATPTVIASDATHDAVSVPYPPLMNQGSAGFFRVVITTP